MELSCIGGFSKLFLQLLHGTACECCLINLFLAFLHGAVVQKLPCKIISEAFAWSLPAKVGLQSYFSSFCMELSCRGCLSKLFLKLLYEGVVQKLPFETISSVSVWNCRAKVALCKILFSISWLLRRAFE